MKATTRHKHPRSEFDLHDDLAKIKAALSDATFDVKGRASEMLHQSIENAKNRSAEAQDTISTFVTEKPLKSLGFAMLTGLVIGYLLHR
jgi:ElaB/YqjD/DUF883 family membrane-anchored ribosome-binding protein